MKRYTEYNESGTEWLGKIPAIWNIKCLKFLADVVPSNVDKKSVDGEKAVRLCNYMDVYKNDYITNGIDFMGATASDAQITKLTLQYGDVIATKDSEDPNDIAVSALVKEDFEDVVCGYHLTLMRPNQTELQGGFLFWLLNSKGCNQFFATQAKGVTRYAVGISSFKNLAIPLPSLEEQTQIAQYLDHKTSQIDKLITDKEKLIELLNEERTAIINQAVTKGLNPDVPMKDSGIEWLGEVPEHWRVIKLFYITSKIGDGLHGTPDYVEESEIFFINGNNIGPEGIKITEQTKKVSIEEAGKQSLVLTEDSLLLSINGTIGNLAFYNGEKVMLGKSVAYINCKKEISREYLFYFLQSKANEFYFNRELSGSTIKNLSLESIKGTPVTCPSLEEQKNIVSFIHEKVKQVNKSLEVVRKEIQLLKEYKTALISEVVTGKVDVRDEIIAESTELVS